MHLAEETAEYIHQKFAEKEGFNTLANKIRTQLSFDGLTLRANEEPVFDAQINFRLKAKQNYSRHL